MPAVIFLGRILQCTGGASVLHFWKRQLWFVIKEDRTQTVEDLGRKEPQQLRLIQIMERARRIKTHTLSTEDLRKKTSQCWTQATLFDSSKCRVIYLIHDGDGDQTTQILHNVKMFG